MSSTISEFVKNCSQKIRKVSLFLFAKIFIFILRDLIFFLKKIEWKIFIVFSNVIKLCPLTTKVHTARNEIFCIRFKCLQGYVFGSVNKLVISGGVASINF